MDSERRLSNSLIYTGVEVVTALNSNPKTVAKTVRKVAKFLRKGSVFDFALSPIPNIRVHTQGGWCGTGTISMSPTTIKGNYYSDGESHDYELKVSEGSLNYKNLLSRLGKGLAEENMKTATKVLRSISEDIKSDTTLNSGMYTLLRYEHASNDSCM